MERVFIRTCSADQATVLARAAGRCARVGGSHVRIHLPDGREPIDPTNPARYVARVEVLDADAAPSVLAGRDAVHVVSDLFGPYLS
jgi:hypothetical protein